MSASPTSAVIMPAASVAVFGVLSRASTDVPNSSLWGVKTNSVKLGGKWVGSRCR
jgi:hypothetical protein